MMTTRRWFLVPAMGLVAVLASGCPKKTPQTKPDDSLPATTTAVTPPTPTAGPTGSDPVASPLDADLVAANDYAYQSGLLGDVYFDFDKFELGAAARERLAKNADFFRQRPEFEITLEGHCDERGTNEYNLALGQSRATAARDYLVSLGVAATRIRILSLGEERPVCSISEESCWRQNRRAHFVLSGRLPAGG